MSPSLRKVGILIITIIVLPLLIFSVFEIGNLRQNEKVIQDIYKNQLEAILFSINQYSDDIISNLASRIENSSNDTGAELARIFDEIPSVKGLSRFDSTLQIIPSVPDLYTDSALIPEMVTLLRDNSKTIRQLQTYLQGGYRKIEPIGNSAGNMQWIVFLTHIQDQEVINVLVIDPGEFISQVLDPKMQEIAKGKFEIAAYREGEELPFYTQISRSVQVKLNNKEPFWLMTNNRWELN